MGVCASCLGMNRHNEDAESSRLLYDDPYQGYGVFQPHHPGIYQPDPEDLKREREALDAICQRTSDSVVDIWALQPHPPSSIDHYQSTASENGDNAGPMCGGDSRLHKPHSKQSLRAKRFAELANSKIDLFSDLEVDLNFKK